MKMRRFVIAVLAICLSLGLLFVSVSAEPIAASGICGEGLTWELEDNGSLTISGSGTMYDYTLDADGKSTAPWFDYEIAVTSVYIRSGVANVGAYAFAGNSDLTYLRNSATTIGDYAFYKCTKLWNITFDDYITDYGDYAFAGCTSLTDTGMGQVTHIGTRAFYKCTSLHDVYIPESIEVWGNRAFEASGLSWVSVSYGTKSIGKEAFRNCPNLQSISIPNTVTNFAEGIFSGCNSVTICAHAGTPAAAYAKQNGISFEAADHDANAENQCSYCDVLMGNSRDLTWSLDKEGNLCLSGEGSMYQYDTGWRVYKDQIVTLTVEEGVTGSISGFSDCVNLVSVSLPEGVTEIFDFACCTSLKTVKLPQSLRRLGKGTFEECTALTSIQLPNGLEEINSTCFFGCTNLQTIRIPASVKMIGGNVFYGCKKLDGIWVDSKNTAYTNDDQGVLFTKDMTELRAAPGTLSGEYKIPETVTSIFNCAFAHCSGLNGVTIPNGVTYLDFEIFANCTSLKTVRLPAKLRFIDTDAFSNCTALKSIYFTGPAPVEIREAFQGVTATVYYPAGDSSWTKEMRQNYGGNLTWVAKADKELKITTQPKNTYVKMGSTAKVTVAAEGEGLEYQWYFKNAGASSYSKSSVTTATYSTTMRDAAKDRRLYCVVTDEYGNSVKSNTVILRMTASVATQPKSVVVAKDKIAKVTLKAVGDGLKYEWYYKDKGATSFKKTTAFTGNSYSVAMTAARHGRQLYCKVTDKYGKTVKTNTVTISMKAAVTTQPKSVVVAKGATAKVTVKAAGDGLKYEWYYKDKGATSFKKTTSFTGTSYTAEMTAARHGRQLYCKITDKYGNTVKTNTVTISMKATVTTQPKSVTVAKGATAKVSFKAVGNGLTYTWYYKDAGATSFKKTTAFTGTSYSVEMTKARSGRQLYCKVTDKYGNTVKTNTVTIKMQ